MSKKEREIYGGYAVESFDLYLAELRSKAVLTPEQEHDLCMRIVAGDAQARATMIELNLRLVVKTARPFYKFGDMADLVAEGNVGLITAIDKFDPTRVGEEGKFLKFSTFATWWIKHAIVRYIHRLEPVHVPHHLQEKRLKIRRAITVLRFELHREPTSEEIAQFTMLSVDVVEEVQMMVGDLSTLSLDMTSDETEHPLEQVLPDTRPAFEDINHVADTDLVRYLLAALPPNERELICDRFGFNEDGEPVRVIDIAHKRHVTRQRVDQIYRSALTLLRASYAQCSL